ncbi:MAG: helix-turn-helix transcriptional regulator [Spirochaetota bacterium]
MEYNNPNSNKSFLLYETYDNTMYELKDAPDISQPRRRLPGDWPVIPKKSITKETTIKDMTQYFDKEQAKKLFNALPLYEWVKCKQYFHTADIYETIKETIERLEIKLKKFDNLTLEEIYNWSDYYDAEHIVDIFKCPPTKENINNITGEYIADITLIILCYVESQWEKRNQDIDSIIYSEVFPIPLWLKLYLPLFSGVAEDKFGRDRGFFDNLEFTTQKDQYIIKIDYLGITYSLSLDKSSLEKYYFGKLKDENFKTVENFIKSLMNEAFSPKGLRYLLAIFLNFERKGRQREIDGSMADYLKGLKAKGIQIKDYEKKDFIKILFVFSNVYILAKPNKSVNKINIHKYDQRSKVFFSYSGDKLEIYKLDFEPTINDIRKFRLRLKLNKTYFDENNYTILPKAIVKEGIGENYLIFFLMTNLALQWVACEDIIISVTDLIKRCGLDSYAEKESSGSYGAKRIEMLEGTLEKLRKKGYIGEWITVKEEDSSKIKNKKSRLNKIKYPIINLESNTKKKPYKVIKQKPSELVDNQWSECSIHIAKPTWLSKKISNYNDTHYYRLSKLEQEVYSGSEIREFRKINNIKQKDLANKLGIAASLLARIEKKDSNLRKELNNKFITMKTEIENR